MEAQLPRVLGAGLFLLVVALPLASFPLSRGAFLDVKLLVLATGTLLCGSRARRIAIPNDTSLSRPRNRASPLPT